MVRVLHSVSIMNRAGQETFIMNVYRKINRKKVQFDFQCTIKEKGDFDDEIKSLGGKIWYLGENRHKNPLSKYIGTILLQYHFFKNHSEYKLFHIHTYHAFDAWLEIIGAKLGGAEKIFLHSHNTRGMHPRLHKFFRILLKYMSIERCACSREAAEWMYGEKELDRVTILKNGIEPQSFIFDDTARQKKRKELGLEENLVIGHIGRFNYQKNHGFLLDIFYEVQKQKPDAKLLLIGTGELKKTIQNKISDLGLEKKVLLLGVRSDIRELLWAMDVFLFPSLFEGLSVVAIEAQAAGTPVLAADTLSEETKLTDHFVFMSLNESQKLWARKALEMAKWERRNTEQDIIKAGYSIEETAGILEKKYCDV